MVGSSAEPLPPPPAPPPRAEPAIEAQPAPPAARWGCSSRVLGTILIAVACSVAARAELPPGITGMGALPKSSVGLDSHAHGISPDGSLVAGRAYTDGGWVSVWWRDGTLEAIPDLPGELPDGADAPQAFDASADGEVVVGNTGSTTLTRQGYRYADGVVTRLGGEPGDPIRMTDALAVSDDGRGVVGRGWTTDGAVAIRWTDGAFEVVAPPTVPDFTISAALGVSADGRVVVGTTKLLGRSEAFRHEDGATERLIGPAGESGLARAVSADGAVIAGYVRTPLGNEVVLWTDGVPQGLGIEVRPHLLRPPLALSADGRLLAGGSLEQGAFLWDPVHGVRDLEEFVQEVDLALGDWRLHEATGISADGRTIVGTGHLQGATQGWILQLPPVCRDTLDNDGDGLVDLDDPSCADPDGTSEALRRDLVLDVRPGSNANVIRPGSPQIVPVAVLGSESVDVLDIDVTRLAFGPADAAPAGPIVFEDVDADGHLDLLAGFRTADAGFAFGDEEAYLRGEVGGSPFEACDAVRTVPPLCGLGFELPPFLLAGAALRRRIRPRKG